MNSPRKLIATLAIILSLSLQSIATVPSYPLRVRGGGRLRVWSEATKTPSLVKLIVEFEAGPGRADAGLRPGQGSWLDRGLRAGEPTRLEYYVHESDAEKIVNYLRTGANYYTFECFNTGKGYMQVTRAYAKSVRID